MAELHKTTLNYYRIRGLKSLLERCIKNDVIARQFNYDFDADAFVDSFINDPESFQDGGKMTITSSDLEKFNAAKNKMIEKKKVYILELGVQAKKKFELNQKLKLSCNETTFKNATFFMSSVFGLFANKIDKDMDRTYDSAASYKTMNKQANECWKSQLKIMLSNDEFNRFDRKFLEDLTNDAFLQQEIPTTSDDSGFISNETMSPNVSTDISTNEIISLKPTNEAISLKPNALMDLSSNDDFSPLMVSSPIPNARKMSKDPVTMENGHIKVNGIVYNNKARLNVNKEENDDPISLKRKQDF